MSKTLGNHRSGYCRVRNVVVQRPLLVDHIESDHFFPTNVLYCVGKQTSNTDQSSELYHVCLEEVKLIETGEEDRKECAGEYDIQGAKEK